MIKVKVVPYVKMFISESRIRHGLTLDKVLNVSIRYPLNGRTRIVKLLTH